LDLKQLIEGCKKGQRTSQRQLFLKFKDVLYYTSLKYCRNTAEAEDNVHDTFIVIFDKIGAYKGSGSFEGWMKRIAINKAISKFKKNIQSTSELPTKLSEDTTIDIEENNNIHLDTILKAIQELPHQYRLVFNMFQLDGYSHKQIAEALSISEGTSKSNYHRAKQLLQKKLAVLTQKNTV